MQQLLFLPIKLLAYLPLSLIQSIGVIFGQLFHLLKPAVQKTLRENLINALTYQKNTRHPCNKQISQSIKLNIAESGKTILESLAIWVSSEQRVLKWVVKVNGRKILDEAIANKKGIIFITPHLGAYEITSIYYGSKHPITILYRRPRKKWLQDLIVSGRSKGLIKLAEPNATGVKKLYQALKNGEAIGILPDQIASKGQGEWANFFGRPAYTMVLLSKLAVKTQANVILAVGERLKNGKGFIIHLEKLETEDIATSQQLNHVIEKKILKWPLQYIWNYDRFKPQAHVTAQEEDCSQ